MLGDHIDFAFGQAAGYITNVESGQFRALAVLQPKRWWAAPNVPTLDELGFRDIDATFWHGLWAPKGTPKDVIAKINAALQEALALAKRAVELDEKESTCFAMLGWAHLLRRSFDLALQHTRRAV